MKARIIQIDVARKKLQRKADQTAKRREQIRVVTMRTLRRNAV